MIFFSREHTSSNVLFPDGLQLFSDEFTMVPQHLHKSQHEKRSIFQIVGMDGIFILAPLLPRKNF